MDRMDRTDRLELLMEAVLETQRKQQERLNVDTQRQDQRWKAMEHQFLQLQRLVRGEEARAPPVNQPVEELQALLNPSTLRPSSVEDLFLHMPPLDIPTPQPPAERDQQANVQGSLNSTGLGTAMTPRLPQGWKAPRMSSFEEDEDIEHYLTTFERLAAASQWPAETWVLHLVPLLKGKARAAYVAMSAEDCSVYSKVKQAILDKFEINAETYRQRFRANTILEGETAKELQARLKDLFGKWLSPASKTKEDICEKMILEQFLDMLNPDLQVWVRERDPQTSMEAATLVEMFVTARRSRRDYQLGPQDSRKKTHHPSQQHNCDQSSSAPDQRTEARGPGPAGGGCDSSTA